MTQRVLLIVWMCVGVIAFATHPTKAAEPPVAGPSVPVAGETPPPEVRRGRSRTIKPLAEIPGNAKIVGVRTVTTEELVEAAEVELNAFAKSKNPADADDAAWSMERYLRDRGFDGAQVDYEEDGSAPRFVVEEGTRKVLCGVRLVGVQSLPREDLMRYFDFPGEGFLGGGQVLYNEALVANGVEQVKREYRLQGFYDVEVDEPKLETRNNGCVVTVVVTIREGCRYRIRCVRVNGVVERSGRCRTELVGEPYTRQSPSAAESIVRQRLIDKGHQFAKVKAKGTPDQAEQCCRADIDVKTIPGPKVRLSCVRIEGLQCTDRRFARSLVEMKSGMVLRQSCIRRAEDNFFRSGIFTSSVAEVVPTGPDTADLKLRLKERKAKRIDLEAGYGSYELLRVGAKYEDRNLFGWGRYFSAEARAHLKGVETEVVLRDPWLFGRQWTLEVTGGYTLREEPSYTFQRLGFTAAVEYQPNDQWTFLGGYRFESQAAFDIQADAPGEDIDGFVTAAGLYLNASFDSRDSVVLPTRGVLAEAGVFWSTPSLGADLSYLEQQARFVSHFTVLGESVLAIGASVRVKSILNNEDRLPIQERYFLGGESSIRSFLESELGPSDAEGDPLGGRTSAQAHAELRFPLGIGALYGATFYELGVVNRRSWDFGGPFGHAVGVGLRYYLPFGPVRLDLGYGFGERFASDSRVALHVAIGFSF